MISYPYVAYAMQSDAGSKVTAKTYGPRTRASLVGTTKVFFGRGFNEATRANASEFIDLDLMWTCLDAEMRVEEMEQGMTMQRAA